MIFEVWFRSKITDEVVWAIFAALFQKWVHRVQVIAIWSVMTLALTKAAADYASKKCGSTTVVSISLQHAPHMNEKFCELVMDNDFLLCAWYRVSYIIPNPTTLQPHVFLIAMQGIAPIVDVWNGVNGLELQSQSDDVSGNSLLSLYGNWLFDGALLSNAGCEEGRAITLEVLCKIFTQAQPTHFFPNHLELFYKTLISVRYLVI